MRLSIFGEYFDILDTHPTAQDLISQLATTRHPLTATLINLRERWQDERKYEDWTDYEKIILKTAARAGLHPACATKRPFGLQLLTADGWLYIRLTIKNGRMRLTSSKAKRLF